MSKEHTAGAPTTGLDWLNQRWATLTATLKAVIELRDELERRDLWRAKDKARLGKVVAESGDYLTSIEVDPELSFAAHKDLCISGPNLMRPCSPSSWVAEFYVWRVDAHLRLLTELARTRLAYDTMMKNPPAAPISDMSPLVKAWRSRQDFDKFVYADCENRPEFQQYLQAMEEKLEQAVAACALDAPRAVTRRYRLANTVLQVTGATRLQLQRFSLDMTPADLLAATEVADRLPTCPQVQAYKSTMANEEWGNSLKADLAKHEQFRRKFNAAWRKLTAGEITEVLATFG